VSSGGQDTVRVGCGSEEGAALACAAGCDVLWRAAGAIAGGGVVWFRGGQVRGPGASPPCLPCLTAWVGAGEAGDRQRSERGCRRVWLQGLGRTGTMLATVV
jgi:hypothetical protein